MSGMVYCPLISLLLAVLIAPNNLFLNTPLACSNALWVLMVQYFDGGYMRNISMVFTPWKERSLRQNENVNDVIHCSYELG